jgi:hypothetical protein
MFGKKLKETEKRRRKESKPLSHGTRRKTAQTQPPAYTR